MEGILNIRFQIPATFNLAEKILSGNMILESETGCKISGIEILFEESRKIEGKADSPESLVSVLGKYIFEGELVLLPKVRHIFSFDLPFSRPTRRHQFQFPLWGKFGQRLRRIYQAVDIETSEFTLYSKITIEGVKPIVETREPIKVFMR
ncbi:MAG: hypothetical protein SF052_18730 [Bacteroidia bacterium]|nr:hypothetical protein [Bacteroidia bacterium]